jgi:CRP-like cAMP-binding protein
MSSLCFAVLKPGERATFLAGCENVVVQKGDIIIEKGEKSNDFYIIDKGSAKAIDEWDKEQVPLAFFKEGDVFGEMAFIYEGTRSATVVANENCTLLKMSKENFIRFMVEEPFVSARFLYGLSRVLIQRLRFADDAFTTLAIANRELKEKTEDMKKSLIGHPPQQESEKK